jgi:hypothetical protein
VSYHKSEAGTYKLVRPLFLSLVCVVSNGNVQKPSLVLSPPPVLEELSNALNQSKPQEIQKNMPQKQDDIEEPKLSCCMSYKSRKHYQTGRFREFGELTLETLLA